VTKIVGAIVLPIVLSAGLVAAIVTGEGAPEHASDALSSVILAARSSEEGTAQVARLIEEAKAPTAVTGAPAEGPGNAASGHEARAEAPQKSEQARAGEDAKRREQAKEAAAGVATKRPASTLEEETRRLREVHGALQEGRPDRALALLEEDERSSAYGGELRQERAAARVLALCKAGKASEASAAAAAFLRENPRSPLAGRVRAACAPSPSPNSKGE
jgi:hypothetical protein